MPEKPPLPLRRTALVGIAVALIGLIVATAATQTQPGPRLSRKARLVDLIRAEDERARALRAELDDLRADLSVFEGGGSLRVRRLDALRKAAGQLAPFAGLAAVRGAGLRIELRDSSLRASPTGDPNDLVIHEQDLQAVVNALWASGAEALAINGERITAASAIRCVGNTLLLHGAVYSPPYRIGAIGDPARMRGGLRDDALVGRFRVAVEEFRLGFDIAPAKRLELPAFRGIVANRFAERA